MTKRVDGVIAHIREIHRKYLEDGIGKRDVMIFSHGAFPGPFRVRLLLPGGRFCEM